MASCLYRGWVRHRRLGPDGHRFRYGLQLLYLDLAELPELFDRFWLWSARRPAPIWWRRADHHGDPRQDLAEATRDLVESRTSRRPLGAVRLLTHPRYFGFGFNPVSFFYCFAPQGTLEAIVAEINNTPWGEQHCYVLPASAADGRAGRPRFRFDKDFHVSPFLPLDMRYDWRFSIPDERLLVHMVNWRADVPVFDATLVLGRVPIDSGSLAGALLRRPFMTGQVVAAIYWEALRLWLRRTPFFTHPDKAGTGHRHRRGRIEGTST